MANQTALCMLFVKFDLQLALSCYCKLFLKLKVLSIATQVVFFSWRAVSWTAPGGQHVHNECGSGHVLLLVWSESAPKIHCSLYPSTHDHFLLHIDSAVQVLNLCHISDTVWQSQSSELITIEHITFLFCHWACALPLAITVSSCCVI